MTERQMLDLIHKRFNQVSPGNGARYVVAEHVRSQAGFGSFTETMRTADAIVLDLWPSSGHPLHGFEVKCSRSDWKRELEPYVDRRGRKCGGPEKHQTIAQYCTYWWLVVPDLKIVRDDLPDGWGLLYKDKTGYLRAKHKAPKREAVDAPLTFIVSLMRAASKTAYRQGALNSSFVAGKVGA